MNRHPLLAPLALSCLGGALSAHAGEEQKLLASDGAAGDGFGRSVALSHETLIVGAPFADAGALDSGAAYVFVHDELTETWVEEAKLVPDDAAAGDLFGWSVTISDDIAVVGAYGNDELGLDAGAAYVFVRADGVWSQEAKLTASDGTAGDGFGFSVAVDGTTALVGSPQFLGPADGTGAAYVYVQAGTLWSEEQILTASDATVGDQYGRAVALSGDTAAVGAPRATGLTLVSGGVYVHSRAAAVWSEDDKLTAADGGPTDTFGISVSLFEDTALAIGAPGDDDSGNNAGAAYHFDHDGTNWNQVYKIRGTRPNDRLGAAVSREYRSSLAGARFDDGQGPDAGVVLMFSEQEVVGTILAEVFIANDPAAGDNLGTSTALHDCWIAVGATGSDSLGMDAGAVYMYAVSSPSVTTINGTGVNPLCMTTTEVPIIGHDMVIEVDASGVSGATSTTVFARFRHLASPIARPFGELLVNRQTGIVFTSTVAGGGLNTHVVPIADDPWLIGLRFAQQGYVRDGSGFIALLCNAEIVRIGCHHDE